MGHGDDRMQDDRPLRLAVILQEGLVDLQRVEGKAHQIGERRIAGAEIVQRQADAECLQAGEELGRTLRIVHHQRFRQLQLEAVRRDPVALDDGLHVADQILADELAAGDVDRDEEVLVAGHALPVAEPAAGLLQRELAELDD